MSNAVDHNIGIVKKEIHIYYGNILPPLSLSLLSQECRKVETESCGTADRSDRSLGRRFSIIDCEAHDWSQRGIVALGTKITSPGSGLA